MPLPAIATDFLYDSEAWIVEPCSIDIRFAAVSVKDGDPHRIIAAAIAVHPFPLMDSDAYVFNLEAGNYWFGQQHLHNLDQEAVRKVLEAACNGRIEVYGKTVELPTAMVHNRINVPNDSFNYALRLEVSAHTITPTGQYEHLFSRMQSFTLLDDILRRSNPPFDGIEDILRWLDLREGLSDVGPSRLRISVGTPIDISGDGTKLNDGTLQISIVAHPTVDVS